MSTASSTSRRGSHDLVHLWAVARGLIELRDHEDTSDLDHAGDVLRQFHEVDPGSMTFRYATDKTGERLLPSPLKRINLETLARVVAAVGNLLEGCTTMYHEEENSAEY